ncbi:DUF6624 domain-containing protein [Gloeobacter morelensis]|uniref:Uncharacterized protein n=1 Tax=Gloeobacter morelensis MG652769 TaxID=2781736 RepID=A0ABY3PHE6_9CYAN|nr:DUF6624 domain-containing protein [Gloeobacter morelensis]UFP93009.1 hypothetical protein ISF26_14435 [Gloeobacter morelensis MG652769]
MDDQLRIELVAMAAEDQIVRAELAADGSLFAGYHPRMEAVHRRNAGRLEAILVAYGWPGRSLVGDEGAAAAFLLLQHAIGFPDLQRSALGLLQQAAAAGEAVPLHSAMLEDRLCTFEGRPQRFGTQFDWDAAGDLSPLPIADPEGVDDRRRAVGLEPLAQQTRRMRAQALLEGQKPPVDFAGRRAEMEHWACSVGWR